jgi:hypothetical protein
MSFFTCALQTVCSEFFLLCCLRLDFFWCALLMLIRPPSLCLAFLCYQLALVKCAFSLEVRSCACGSIRRL